MKEERGNMKEGKPEDLKIRTRKFALRVISLYGAMPKRTESQVIGKQMLRSGTSVGAHYREALRARSTAEYISKLEGGMQELEETMYWFELIVDSGIFSESRISDLAKEADELMAILTTIVKRQKGQ
ncbi:MAG: four helix bundle protein [Deltaproteobacteria bacterium]|nr:MAG: four helix bundle protein [Deltaproteobacteria bacterium]